MTGDLAQLITLVTHFNSRQYKVDLLKHNSNFKFCNKLSFISLKKRFLLGLKETIVAKAPEEWFEYLLANGVTKLNIMHQSDNSQAADYKLASFVGGGGSWFIEAKKSSTSDIWQSRWNTKPESERRIDDKKIWNIDYGRVAADRPHVVFEQTDIDTQKEKLRDALLQISAFAKSFEYTKFWAENYFDKAIKALTSENPIEDYNNKDLVPISVTNNDSLQLLMAACRSFVFGGMGSWNDFTFDDKSSDDKYEELSERLYSTMNESFVVATNGL